MSHPELYYPAKSEHKCPGRCCASPPAASYVEFQAKYRINLPGFGGHLSLAWTHNEGRGNSLYLVWSENDGQ